MNISEIKEGLANGSLVLSEKKLFTREQYDKLNEAKKQEEYFDLLQLTKKIQL